MNVWPNFFIIGVAKAGTTSLYAYLKNTPNVFMSSEKEPGYFHGDIIPRKESRRMRKQSDYLKLFNKATNEKAIGEASPGYLTDPESAKLIHEAVPNAKIIALLRDPVNRAFSHYLMRRTKGVVKQTFHEVITKSISNEKKGIVIEYNFVLFPGLYTNNLRKFQDMFGINNVKILVFEEFVKEPKKIVKEVLRFLEVDAEPPDTIEKTYNVYGAPRGKYTQIILSSDILFKFARRFIPQSLRWEVRQKVLLKKEEKPKLADEDRAILEDFYREDAENLQVLLKRKLPWPWISQG